MVVAVAELWEEEREEVEEEELQMRRNRRLETAVDFIDGVAFQTDMEEEIKDDNENGDIPNHKQLGLENGEFNHQLSLPENGESKDKFTALDNDESKDEFPGPEDCESKDMFFVPENGEANDKLSVLENGESSDELSAPGNGKSKDQLSVPENGESNNKLSVPENGESNNKLSVPENGESNDKLYELGNGESNNELSVPVNGHVHSSSDNCEFQLSTKDPSSSCIKTLPTEKSVEDLEISQFSSAITINGVDTEVSNEGNEELNDLDVERVLKEQNAYDLFCPNCNSCITKRVILRKRKRSVKISVEEGKRNKPEIINESLPDDISELTTDNQGNTTESTTIDCRVVEPEVFRCLACFTFFIPSGNGLKFNVFGNRREKEILQNSEQTPAVKKNWFFSLFSSRKQEMFVDKDQEILSPLLVSSSAKDPEVTRTDVADGGEKSDEVQKQVTEALPGKGSSHCEVSERSVIFKPQQDESMILLEPSKEKSGVESSQLNQKLNTTTGKKGTGDVDSLIKPVSVFEEPESTKVDLEADFPSQNWHSIGIKQSTTNQSGTEVRNVEVTFNDSSHAYGFPHSNAGTKVDIHFEKSPQYSADVSIPSLTTPLLLPDTQADITKDLVGVPDIASAGGDTITIVTDKGQTVISQSSQDIIASTVTGHTNLTERIEDREFRGFEVIKSIVYGGLVESITSLSVVSAAVGSETAIINIVALGLANLIGGLFIISHNLWDLKNDDHGVIYSQEMDNTPNEGTQRLDKYRDLLGRGENFLLHATVAILSYIIFGLVPPVIYGFSFRESNDRDFKLIAVAISSILCIAVLALGKAYVQRPPKNYIKTVLYYIFLGFMVSGASFVAGDLINKLMQKLGWLNSGVDLSVPMIVESQIQTKWSSY